MLISDSHTLDEFPSDILPVKFSLNSQVLKKEILRWIIIKLNGEGVDIFFLIPSMTKKAILTAYAHYRMQKTALIFSLLNARSMDCED